jgi:hypothetical protein
MNSTLRAAPVMTGIFGIQNRPIDSALTGAFAQNVFMGRAAEPKQGMEPTWPALTGSRHLPYDGRRRFPRGINRECGEDFCKSDSAAAPATVSGEPFAISHWTSRSGKAVTGIDPRARRPAVSRGHTRSALGGVSWWVSSRIHCEYGPTSFAVTCHVTASRS